MKPLYLMNTSNTAVLIDTPFESFKLNRNGRVISLITGGNTFNLCEIENVGHEIFEGNSVKKSEAGMTPVQDLPIAFDELLYCTGKGTELEFTYDEFKCVRFKFYSINTRKVLVYILGIVKSNGLDISKLVYQVYQTNVVEQETKETSFTEDIVRAFNDKTNTKRNDPYIRSNHKR